MKLTDDFGYLLHRASASLSKQSDAALQDQLGIGFSQVRILMALNNQPNIKQKQIANMLNQTEASISRQIKIMFEEGLLASALITEDRRQHITSLTPRGIRIHNEAAKVLQKCYLIALEPLNVREQDQFIQLLRKFSDNQ